MARMLSTTSILWNGVVSPSSAEPILRFIFNHYHTVAYSIVIIAYVLSFGEYAILRIKSLTWPERQVYFSVCGKRSNEVIGKTAFHYAVVLVAFVVIALFQLVCFFGLTISTKWMYYTINEDIDRVVQMRQKLAAEIRTQVYNTSLPTFACYISCSFSIFIMIYYMDGVQDAVDSTVTNIILYIFDAVVLGYFLSFPLVTCVYRHSASAAISNGKDDRNNNNIVYVQTTNCLTPVASTDTSGLAPILFPRRFSYVTATDDSNHNHIRERIGLVTDRTSSSFVRNVKITTTV